MLATSVSVKRTDSFAKAGIAEIIFGFRKVVTQL